MKKDADIESIEPDYTVKVEEENTAERIPWGVENVGASLLQNKGFLGQGVNVAVFDTGVSSHPDINLSGGIFFVDGVESYVDDNGHGTHVAGIISALQNGLGVIGVAPQSNIYAVKVLDSNGSGRYSSIIEGIDWAIDNNIKIINMSFGGSEYSKILEKAIDEAYKNNILILASAGNNGKMSSDTIAYPAKYKQVIAVGAVDNSGQRAYFSSVGPDLELMAPGVDIESTSMDGSYVVKSGTSMASPHVAGVAALIWSQDLSVPNSKIEDVLKFV